MSAKTPKPKPERRPCACGCGKTFVPVQPHQKYLNPAHRNAHWTALHPRVGVSSPAATPLPDVDA